MCGIRCLSLSRLFQQISVAQSWWNDRILFHIRMYFFHTFLKILSLVGTFKKVHNNRPRHGPITVGVSEWCALCICKLKAYGREVKQTHPLPLMTLCTCKCYFSWILILGQWAFLAELSIVSGRGLPCCAHFSSFSTCISTSLVHPHCSCCSFTGEVSL